MGKQIKKRQLPLIGGRSCGPCTACCTALQVTEGTNVRVTIDKPKWTACEHIVARGCGIYKSRPLACRTFKCGWLSGAGKDSDRPDRIGVVFYVEDTAIGHAVIAQELEQNTFDSLERAQALVQVFAEKAPVIIMGRDSDGLEFRRVVTHDPTVASIVQAAMKDTDRLELE